MRTGTGTFIAIAALLANHAAGCSSESEGSSGKGTPKATLAEVESALPQINGAVPEALRGQLRFETATVEDGELAAAVPAGWESGHIPGRYRPGDGSSLGFMTSYSVGANCDGECKPKDWQATATKVELSQFLEGDFTIEKDEKLGDNGRLLVARSSDSTYVVATWWKKDASKYYYCRASLADDAATAAAAFEQACRSTRVLAW